MNKIILIIFTLSITLLISLILIFTIPKKGSNTDPGSNPKPAPIPGTRTEPDT